MAAPGELFSDEILSCLDQEKELHILMLAVSQQYESSNAPPITNNNSARASTTIPAPTTTTTAVPSRFAPPKTYERSNRSHRPGQRDVLKIDPTFGPMKLRDFKSPGSKRYFIFELREFNLKKMNKTPSHSPIHAHPYYNKWKNHLFKMKGDVGMVYIHPYIFLSFFCSV